MRSTILRPLFALVAACCLFCTHGCVQQFVTVTVNSDGTGTLAVTMAMADSMKEMAGSMASSMGGEGGEASGGDMDMVGDAKKKAENYPAEWNVKVEEYKGNDDYSGVTITAEFKSPEQLKEIFEEIVNDASSGSDGKTGAFSNFAVATSGEENEIWTISASFTLEGESTEQPEPDWGDDGGMGGDGMGGDGMGDDGMGDDGMGTDDDGDGLQGDDDAAAGAAMAMMSEMANMKIVFAVSMPSIQEVTCKQTSGGSREVGQISGNTATFEFKPVELGMGPMNSGSGEKEPVSFDIKVVGSTKGGMPMMMLIIIAVLAVVVLGVIFFVITKK